jgi:hypothetical protein
MIDEFDLCGADVEENAIEPAMAEALDVDDAAIFEPFLAAIAIVAESQYIEDNLALLGSYLRTVECEFDDRVEWSQRATLLAPVGFSFMAEMFVDRDACADVDFVLCWSNLFLFASYYLLSPSVLYCCWTHT